MRWTYRRFLNETIKPSGEEYFDGVPYVAYTTDKEIKKLDTIDEYELFYFDENRIEEIVYNEAVNYMKDFQKQDLIKMYICFVFMLIVIMV